MVAFGAGEIDAAQAMIYNEYAQVLETKNPATGKLYTPDDLNVISWEQYGTSMLQDAIFASDAWLKQSGNEDVAVKFLTASFKGWIFCRDNPAECVDIVLKHDAKLPKGHQTWQLNEVNGIIWPAPNGIGITDKAAFDRTVQVALDGKILTKPVEGTPWRNDLAEKALDGPDGRRHQGRVLAEGRRHPHRGRQVAVRFARYRTQARRPAREGRPSPLRRGAMTSHAGRARMRHDAPMTDPTADTFDFGRFEALTFDCYGTLIDWEAGSAAALRRLLGPAGAAIDTDALLESYAGFEADAERPPYRTYREVLSIGGRGVAAAHGIEPIDDAVDAFAGSVVDWPAFDDSAAALAQLKTRFRLGVLTNCDDDLFAASNRRLGVEFDWIVTAQQCRGYKPDERNFERAVRAPRAAAGADPARRPEPVPRPRAGQGARPAHRLDRPPPRPTGCRGDPARRRAARLTFHDMASFAAAATR